MSSPLPTLLVCLTYVYIVKVLGPQLMANRKPFELRRTLIGYNLFQVIFSSWLFYEVSVPHLYVLTIATTAVDALSIFLSHFWGIPPPTTPSYGFYI